MKIEITKQVVFRDREGTLLKVYEVGDVIEAFSQNGHYFVTSMGGIYLDEAKLVSDEI